jgi:protein-disulfide isomerase
MKLSKTTAVLLLSAAAIAPAFARKDKSKAEPPPAAPAAAAAPTGDTGLAAKVGDTTITLEQLDKAAANQLSKIRQQEYDVRAEVLQGMIEEQLITNEAAAQKIPTADLVQAEIIAKAVKPTPDEAQQFYDRFKSRMGGKSFDEVKGDIEKTLTAQKVGDRKNQYVGELSAKYDVKMMLDPPRATVTLRPGTPVSGPEDAPVTIVEWSDYECPFCKRAYPTVEQVLTEYKGKVKYVHLDYPLPFHQKAMPASLAVHCAGEQGKFWEYNNNLYSVAGDLSSADLTKRATDLGLDNAAFEACTTSRRFESKVKTNYDDGAALGVTGTPAFFINGRMLVGAQPIDQFRTIINDELSRKGVAPPKPSTGTN